jgi:hypothetical protein
MASNKPMKGRELEYATFQRVGLTLDHGGWKRMQSLLVGSAMLHCCKLIHY